ncbi:protein trichome birefringence-like 2 [Typha angustifolia]|uniref:protein trichome birefringence-like 2 n=1 Tax=Typha angustifolia TaxID=59011 RepID=UPI003C2F1B2F
MDWRKISLSFERAFSSLSSKRKVVSGFGVFLVASLSVVFLLSSIDAPASAYSSALFSWFLKPPKIETFSSSKEGGVDFEKAHDGNSSKGPFDGREMGNLTSRGNGSSNSVIAGGILEKTQDGELGLRDKNGSLSSNGSSTGLVSDLGKNSTENWTEEIKGSNSSVDFDSKPSGGDDVGSSGGQTMPSEKIHGRNSSSNETTGRGGGIPKATIFETKDGDGDHQRNQSYGQRKNFSHSSSEANLTARMAEAGANEKGEPSQKCDIFDGRWVKDKNYGYYPAGSCPYIDVDFNCHKNGRPDRDFLKWRWQPYGCNIPRLNGTDFLERLRGKRIIFVGDSLNRNMWESLVCILRHTVGNKKRVYEVSGKKQFKTRGYYSFRFEDYKCYVDFVRSPFIVKEFYKNVNGSLDEKLRLDILDETTSAYRKADIIVFNTGHWWTHEKTSKGIHYYQEGNYVYPVLKVMEAYKKALTTWATWVDKNINSKRTQVVFRGYSLTHFRGGQWNSGGQCHKEMDPIFNQSYLHHYPSKMRALEQILRQMKTPVLYLNISRLTDYRKDGHPSIYRKKYNSVEEQIAAERSQDCSHWCLPGIPDSWNELLYASLLMAGKGSWS